MVERCKKFNNNLTNPLVIQILNNNLISCNSKAIRFQKMESYSYFFAFTHCILPSERFVI